jgi:LuxR family transcriptional regulator, maltose regulon positive regulatory protein
MESLPESAKLKIPVPRRNYIQRSGLLDTLRRGLELPIVYVCSGAGTGKTTLLASFIRGSKLKNAGWFSLDSSTANVYSFWQYVVSALDPFLDDNTLLSLIKSNPSPSHMEQLLESFCALISAKDEYFLVIDDLQYMTDAALIRSFDFFLTIMPENLHLILLSRANPPVYLGQYAVSGKLLFINADEMKLSEDDSISFLRTTLGIEGPDTDLKQLSSYAEGWIAGLQLAAAAEQNRTPMQGGSITADYLNREIFASLSPDEQNFLVCTGPLAYFDASICSEVLDGFTAAQFRNSIDSLTEKNLFIVCIDEENHVYRYHNILSDFLLKQFSHLPSGRQKVLLEKAAAAFELRTDITEAIRLLILAEDYRGAMDILLKNENLSETWSFLDSIPVPILVENQNLAFQCFLYNIGVLNIERCRILHNALFQKYEGTDFEKVLQYIQIFRIDAVPNRLFNADIHMLSIEQIEALPLQNVLKSMILLGNSQIFLNRFQYREAEQCIEKAMQCTGDSSMAVMAFCWGSKAQLYEEDGQLNRSLDCYNTALQLYNASDLFAGLGTNYYIGATGVFMRRMELDKAQEMLDKSDSIYKKYHRKVPTLELTLQYHTAEMNFLRGGPEKGKVIVESMVSQFAQFGVLNLGRLLMELDCAGMLEPSLAQHFQQELSAAADIYRSMLFMQLLETRILAEKGDRANAFRKIDEIMSVCRSSQNSLRLVEAGLIKIYMLTLYPDEEKKKQEKTDLLRETISYAWENRILMPYFLERNTILPLLRGLDSATDKESGLSSSEKAFVRDAVAVCSGKNDTKENAEGLSSREIDVLRELSSGITNLEIADRLCISLATVKTHVQSIYSKLCVSSRTAASKKAKEEGIL